MALNRNKEAIRPKSYFIGKRSTASSGAVIVSITLVESVNHDMIQVLARPTGDRIAFRVVDDYDSKFTFAPETSIHPLSREEFLNFLESIRYEGESNSIFERIWDMNFEATEEDPGVFFELKSLFYMGLNLWITDRYQAWRAGRIPAPDNHKD